MKPLIMLDHDGGDLTPETTRLCENLRYFLGNTARETEAVILGKCPDNLLNSAGIYGIQRIYHIRGPEDYYYSPEVRSGLILDILSTEDYNLILFPDSPNSRETAPLMAYTLNAGLISNCVLFNTGNGTLESVLKVYGGQYQMVCGMDPEGPHVAIMADINRGYYEPDLIVETEIIHIDLREPEFQPAVALVDKFEVSLSEMKFDEAKLVVGIGRGVSDRDGLKQVEELAGIIKAKVGGSRPAAEAGFISPERQIGQTGKVIFPETYLAVGISGAAQHLSGIEKGKIIAINSDPSAPIMRRADLAAVGDYKRILPLLIHRLKETGEGRP